MGYDFYLGKCLLPVAPQSLQISIKNDNKTVTLINEGQINLLKQPGLSDIEFECLIPQVEYPFAVYKSGFQSVAYYLDQFEQLKSGLSPFQFIVARALPDGGVLFGTNIKVSMEDYRITESADNGFDLKVKIRLKQYRDYSIKTVAVSKSATAVPTVSVTTSRTAENSPAPATAIKHTVLLGESMISLAMKYYGDGSKYTAILNANKGMVSSPVDVQPGLVLTIPAVGGK